MDAGLYLKPPIAVSPLPPPFAAVDSLAMWFPSAVHYARKGRSTRNHVTVFQKVDGFVPLLGGEAPKGKDGSIHPPARIGGQLRAFALHYWKHHP